MTPLESLKSILAEHYVDDDGDTYQVKLKPALSEQEIEAMRNKIPNQHLPEEIRDLLKFSSGFEFYGLEEITFDGVGVFGFENLFPYSVQLADDGFGNFWILDLQNNGNWGNVFYVCHDPAVVVKHSENLAQFIQHVHEYGKKGSQSNLDQIHENVVMDIWSNNNGFVEIDTARNSNDTVLRNFAASILDNYLIADLRNKPIQSGFAWGKFGMKSINIKRHDTELIWGVEKPLKKGFFSRLFGF